LLRTYVKYDRIEVTCHLGKKYSGIIPSRFRDEIELEQTLDLGNSDVYLWVFKSFTASI